MRNIKEYKLLEMDMNFSKNRITLQATIVKQETQSSSELLKILRMQTARYHAQIKI